MPDAGITGAWQDVARQLPPRRPADLGSLTPAEQVRFLAATGVPGDAVPPLDELATLHAELEYSGHPVAPDASDRAWDAADDVRDALLVGVGTGTRVRRALKPGRTEPED